MIMKLRSGRHPRPGARARPSLATGPSRWRVNSLLHLAGTPRGAAVAASLAGGRAPAPPAVVVAPAPPPSPPAPAAVAPVPADVAAKIEAGDGRFVRLAADRAAVGELKCVVTASGAPFRGSANGDWDAGGRFLYAKPRTPESVAVLRGRNFARGIPLTLRVIDCRDAGTGTGTGTGGRFSFTDRPPATVVVAGETAGAFVLRRAASDAERQ